jgi:hypothetical protein
VASDFFCNILGFMYWLLELPFRFTPLEDPDPSSLKSMFSELSSNEAVSESPEDNGDKESSPKLNGSIDRFTPLIGGVDEDEDSDGDGVNIGLLCESNYAGSYFQ